MRWLVVLFFAVIGASVITFAFSMMVSISPELNQFSVSILKSKNIDLILVMFPVSLILSGIVVISFIPRNKKVSKKNSPESGKRKLGSFSSQNSIQGDQAKVAADKRNSVQSQYKEHKEKIDLVLAEVKAIRAEIKMFKQKRNAIQAQMKSLFTKHKDSRSEHGKKRDASTEYAQLKQEVDALEKKFETSSVGIKKEKEMVLDPINFQMVLFFQDHFKMDFLTAKESSSTLMGPDLKEYT